MQQIDDAGQSYSNLLKQFTLYKEKSIEEKQNLLKQLQKCKSYIDRFKDKVEKKWQNRVTDQRNAGNQKLQRQTKLFQRQISTLRQVLQVKDKLIDDLKNNIKLLQSERKSIVEANTKMLLDINQDLSYPPPQGKYSHSYTELLRMYQYLILENNELKKQLKSNEKHEINHHRSMLIDNPIKAEGKDKDKGKIPKEKGSAVKKIKK